MPKRLPAFLSSSKSLVHGTNNHAKIFSSTNVSPDVLRNAFANYPRVGTYENSSRDHSLYLEKPFYNSSLEMLCEDSCWRTRFQRGCTELCCSFPEMLRRPFFADKSSSTSKCFSCSFQSQICKALSSSKLFDSHLTKLALDFAYL